MNNPKINLRDVSETSRLFSIYNQEKGDYEVLQLTPKQKEIYNVITTRAYPYCQCISYTQYGKSSTVAAAVTARVATHAEKWALVAPSTEKAKIIMRKIFEFCSKSKMFSNQLEMSEDQAKSERLLRETSKKRIVFKNGGEIFLLSADNRNKEAAGETLLGFGAPNVIIDESSLIDDDIYSKIVRMLGGSKDHFLFEIGNPFKRNHFFKTWHDDQYYKILIDYRVGIEEGRIDEKFVEKMRKEFDFDVMYECQFPKEQSVDSDGWSILFTEVDVENSFRDSNTNTYGEKRLGVDIARSGGNYNVWVIRSGNYAEIVGRTRRHLRYSHRSASAYRLQ
jgi:hypothetical protein